MRRLHTKIAAALLAASMLFGLAGCSDSNNTVSSESSTAASVSEESTPDPTLEPTPEVTETPTETPTATAESVKITLADIPAYAGDPYVAINDNVPYFSDSELTTDSFE